MEDDESDDEANTTATTNGTANDSEEETDELKDAGEDEDEQDSMDIAVKEEETEGGKAVRGEGERKKRLRRPGGSIKDIVAVQYTPKVKTLKKNRRVKVVQIPSAKDWHLPMYVAHPWVTTHVRLSERRRRRRRKPEDQTKFHLRISPSFEDGSCPMDECVFEDVRDGVQVSDFLRRKLTPRKITRTLCKHLWNTTAWGVLTNGKRRSLYEANIFQKRLREVCIHSSPPPPHPPP
jgi:hypothetical protein